MSPQRQCAVGDGKRPGGERQERSEHPVSSAYRRDRPDHANRFETLTDLQSHAFSVDNDPSEFIRLVARTACRFSYFRLRDECSSGRIAARDILGTMGVYEIYEPIPVIQIER